MDRGWSPGAYQGAPACPRDSACHRARRCGRRMRVGRPIAGGRPRPRNAVAEPFEYTSRSIRRHRGPGLRDWTADSPWRRAWTRSPDHEAGLGAETLAQKRCSGRGFELARANRGHPTVAITVLFHRSGPSGRGASRNARMGWRVLRHAGGASLRPAISAEVNWARSRRQRGGRQLRCRPGLDT